MYSFIFQPTEYSPEVHHCVCRSFDKANENSSPELKNIPNWIVGLTELHGKSIEDRVPLECVPNALFKKYGDKTKEKTYYNGKIGNGRMEYV
jgi:hypothetical protein